MNAKDANKPESRRQAPVAIIGMGCMFPGAKHLGAYWVNIREGIDAITEIPTTHWKPADYYREDPKVADHTYAKRGGFLEPIDFNPFEFGIPPNALEATDTSQLLGMYAADRALRDAGYGTSRTFDRDRVSVILGVTGALELVIPLGARLGHPQWRQTLKDAGVEDAMADDVLQRMGESYVPWQEASFPGLLGNVVAGRISKHLNLGGTNCVVDAACASSLSAIHLALMELEAGRADMVLSGGVDTFNDIFMYMCFSKTPALSPTGNAKPFDASGDGTILGEGLGIVVLKRLEDAQRDGDRVYAVIRGMGSSSDGKGDAIYAPNAKGQAKALRRAYENAGIDASSISLVEAHGTGTAVGDAVEVKALREVYGLSGDGPWCALGSVKSQIGHTKAAAGAAGVIKAALALHAKVLPPTIKVQKPLDALREDKSAFYINTVKRPWVAPEGQPRRAAISALGFGGSNFHCILEEANPKKAAPDWSGKVEVFAYSADSAESLGNSLAGLDVDQSWDSLAALADESRRAFSKDHRYRLTFAVHEDTTDLRQLLGQVLKKCQQEPESSWSLPGGAFHGVGAPEGKLAFLFPGQGAQYVGMLRDVACQFPEFLECLERADAAFLANPESSRSLQPSNAIYPPSAFDPEEKKSQELRLRATEIAQPAIGAASVGALRVLESFGIQADAVAGHSFGELVALHAAGRIDEDTLHRIARIRGEAMRQAATGDGAMLAVRASLDAVTALLSEEGLDLVIANKNAPEQMILSGAKAGIERAQSACAHRKFSCTPLPVAAAFHSAHVAVAREPLFAALEKEAFIPGRMPVFSNTTGNPYPEAPEAARALLADQLLSPVEFIREIETLYAWGARSFLEVGPGARMTGLVQAILGGHTHEAFALDSSSGKRDGILELAQVLCRIAAQGRPVSLDRWNLGCVREMGSESGEKPRMTIALSGANHVTPRAPRPAAPPKPAARTESSVPSPPAANQGASKPMKETVPTPAPGNTNALLELTQANIAALQKVQEQTAQLHRQFLEGQQAAVATFQSLMEQQRALLSGTPVPAYAAPSFSDAPISSVQQVAVEPTIEPAAVPEPADQGGIAAVLLDVVSGKTGYPIEMLELSMTLDGDLGIDSIKRVEIMSVLKERLPDAPEIGPEHLATLDTLQKIVEHLSVGVTMPATLQSSGTSELVSVLLQMVADKTGYPVEMLDLDMALDADLGIDSIKRVEIMSALREALPHAPEVGPAELGTLHTLRQVAEYLGTYEPGEDDAATAAEARGKDAPATAAARGKDAPATVLLEVVAEKTGYPVEMLDLNMSLDADLGIDSIKRVEILSVLQQRLPHLPPVGPEQVGQLHTLGQIVAFWEQSGAAMPDAERVEPVAAVQAESTPEVERTVERLVLTCNPLEGAPTPEIDALAGDAPCFVLSEGGPLDSALLAALESRNLQAELLSMADLDTRPSPDKVGGLLLPTPSEDEDDAFLENAFRALQWAAKGLRNSAASGSAVFATISRLDGQFGFGPGQLTSPISGGLAGLAKTVHHEWHGVHCKAIDVSLDLGESAEAAEAIVQEVFRGGPIEVGLTAGGRTWLQLSPAALENCDTLPLLKPGSLVVISGGARGVTAEVAVALADAAQPAILLLGRSPFPEQEPAWLEGVREEAAIKRAIMEHAEAPLGPKDLRAAYDALLAGREIKQNIERMQAAGASVSYRPLDIRNAAAVSEAIQEARDEFGPVAGIVHGAGVLADKLIEDKTLDQFRNVYRTKVAGLRNLLAACGEDALAFCALFASSTARYGRKGQADYAIANEVLNKLGHLESRRRPDCRVVSINWGPWEGGMVTPELARLFTEEGVGLIDLQVGAKYLVAELASGRREAVEVVVLGFPVPKKLGESRQYAAPGNGKRSAAPTSKEALSTAFELDVDVARFPFLASHVMKGKAVVPVVMSIEWMAHAALHANPGLKFGGVDNMEVFKGVLLQDNGRQHLCFHTGKPKASRQGYLVHTEMWGASDKGLETLHCAAEIYLAQTLPERPVPTSENTPHMVSKLSGHYKDGRLFHGPQFHVIDWAEIGEQTACATINAGAATPTAWLRSPLRTTWITHPLAIDAAFQLAILWSTERYGIASLPVRFRSYRQYQRAFPATPLQVMLSVRAHTEHRATFDIEFKDRESGLLVASIQDYECVLDASLNEAFRLNSLQSV